MGLEHFQVWKCFKRRKFFKSQNYKIDNCNFITIRRHVTIFYRTRWKKIETSSRSFIKKKKKKLAFPPEKTSIHLRGRSKMKNPPTRVTKQRWKPAVSAILPRYNEALAVYKGIRHDRIDQLWNTKQRCFVLYNIVFINLTSTMHPTMLCIQKF